MKDSLIIKFLYDTVAGRIMLKGLVDPRVSKVAATFLSSGLSRVIIPEFIRKNNIDISRYEIPRGGYASFNEFFKRKLKEEYMVKEDAALVAPCDALLTVSKINEDLIFNIKHTEYDVASLLNSEKLAKEFYGGTALIFRLTPAHYHRYVFCTDGIIKARRRIKGILHSVQPVCHEKTKVFIENSRELVVIDSKENGKIVQMEIGALLVGKINNYPVKKSQNVRRWQKKGNFEYGGSSIVVLVQDNVKISPDILNREKEDNEIPVVIGEKLIVN